MAKPLLLFVSLESIKDRNCHMSQHVLYNTWRGIIERCLSVNSPSYLRYGAKGVSVYYEWKDKARHPVHKRWSKGFCCFLEYIEKHLGPKPEGFSLDRINGQGNYEPGNLRWANASIQKKNQKVKNNTGYKYVYAISRSTCWQGEYKLGKKRVYVGSFKTKEEAYFSVLAHRLEKMWPTDL